MKEQVDRTCNKTTVMKVKDLLILIGSKYTVEILRYINEHKTAQYKELANFATFTLNRRLAQLLKVNFIRFYMQRGKNRKEFYSMTYWGEEFLKIFESIEDLVLKEKRRRFFWLLSKEETRKILEYLLRHAYALFSDLQNLGEKVPPWRVHELREFSLIAELAERADKAFKQYEIAQNGKRVLKFLEYFKDLFLKYSNEQEQTDEIPISCTVNPDTVKSTDFLELLAFANTIEILFYLSDQGKAHYSDFDGLTSQTTLNHRLNLLLQFGIIKHFIKTTKGIRKWYRLTGNGYTVVELLRTLAEIAQQTLKGPEEKERELLRLFCSSNSFRILEYLGNSNSAGYFHLRKHFGKNILNSHLYELKQHNLIKCPVIQGEIEVGWYEITEKGREVLNIITDMKELVEKNIEGTQGGHAK